MQAFKKKLKVRLVWEAAGFAFALALLVARQFMPTPGGPHVSDFILGFQDGALVGVAGAFLVLAIVTIRSLSSEEKLKKQYIEENDERSLLILQKSGSTGMNIAMFGLLLGAGVAGLFNVTVFFTLLGAGIFVVLVRGAFKLYYHFKY